MKEGWIVYANTAADVPSPISGGDRVAVFSRKKLKLPGGVCFYRVRPSQNYAADMAAVQVQYPHVKWRFKSRGIKFDGDVSRRDQTEVVALKKCDVLSVIFGEFDTWVDVRGKRFSEFLDGSGIQHGYISVGDAAAEGVITNAIERTGCKVVLNELCVATPFIIGRLARKFPAVKFVSLSHGSPCFENTGLTYGERIAGHQILSAQVSNAYLGTVMPKGRFDEITGSKVIELPNFITVPEVNTRPSLGPPLSVSVIGRRDAVKGFPAAVSALVRLNKSRDIHAFIATTDLEKTGCKKLDFEGVPYTHLKWRPWAAMLKHVANMVDIGLQLSLSESFNLVSVEHMLLGKPVVGTQAIEYLPKAWQVNPQDPAAAVKVVEAIADNYERESKRAKAAARKVQKYCNSTLIKNLAQLLE